MKPQRFLVMNARDIPELIHPADDGPGDLAIELRDDGKEEGVGAGQFLDWPTFAKRFTHIDAGAFPGEQVRLPDRIPLAEQPLRSHRLGSRLEAVAITGPVVHENRLKMTGGAFALGLKPKRDHRDPVPELQALRRILYQVPKGGHRREEVGLATRIRAVDRGRAQQPVVARLDDVAFLQPIVPASLKRKGGPVLEGTVIGDGELDEHGGARWNRLRQTIRAKRRELHENCTFSVLVGFSSDRRQTSEENPGAAPG